MKTFKKLFYLFNAKEKLHLSFLLVMILIMAFLDMIGVASILPFMAVLTNPSIVETNMILKNVFQSSKIFGIENYQQFTFVLGVLVFILLVVSLSFKAITIYIQVRFIHMQEYTISRRLFEGYLRQPYSWFISRNSADLGKTILSVVKDVIWQGINPLMELIAKGVIAIALIILLIITDPKLAVVVGLSISLIYSFIFFFFRNFLTKIGRERLKSDRLRFTSINEAFGAAKEVKFGGLEEVYIKKYSDSAKTFALNQAQSTVIVQLPRFIIESIAFGGILLIILYMMKKTESFNDALPILSLYIFAGYRLMPALQQLYGAFTQITFVSPSIDALTNDIKNLKQLSQNQTQGKLKLKKKILLDDVYYNYPNSSRTALKGINIDIPVKSTVGIIGTTGCGKTTTVDIILGLLEPQKGALKVDGQIVTKKNLRAWQRSIGYVPQQIYLTDDTIEANIAFGVDYKDISQKVIEKVSKIANLHDFVTNELPNKYQTIIGERGVRLSGGQKQRIGIARALYHNPQLLILDEATSSLDNQTEQAVMEAVNNISEDITIIIIAHRLNTVKNCNIIFKFEKGEVIKKEINK
jgi:ATP-binding cassette, subfamily B, bacterial PglK